ncbi:MAG: hypothetical protein KZQ70_02710 [gamma proteobacterium symbiont of Lucinoma myriamae]|nr:hypothetical protein [gamma proteobacterium symbiont of Lucinoma myriamae]MCU7817469.1 hypothetical protein [gamma proteobacterium symbiont of Lucinoma myriamae]MCU7831493.1 hypothetical protein [gamma proteobacterium symbiont of Lucinoma myriamae]
MAIKVNYIDDGKGVEISASGVLTGKALIDAHNEIYAAAKVEPFLQYSKSFDTRDDAEFWIK